MLLTDIPKPDKTDGSRFSLVGWYLDTQKRAASEGGCIGVFWFLRLKYCLFKWGSVLLTILIIFSLLVWEKTNGQLMNLIWINFTSQRDASYSKSHRLWSICCSCWTWCSLSSNKIPNNPKGISLGYLESPLFLHRQLKRSS